MTASRWTGQSGRRWALLGAGAVLVAALVIPGRLVAGLSPEAARSAALMAGALLLWISEALPVPVTSILALALLPLTGVLGFDETLAAFAGSTVWILIAVGWIALGVEDSGLHHRLARWILRLTGGGASGTVFGSLVASLMAVFVVPIGVARTALFLPLVNGIAEKYDDPNLRRAIYLGVSHMTIVGSCATMLGGTGIIYAVGLFRELVGHTWDYGSWLVAFFPAILLYALGLWPLLLLLFPLAERRAGRRPEPEDVATALTGRAVGARAATTGEPLSAKQARATVLVLLLLVGNLLVPVHGVPTEVVTLAVGACTLLPGVGVVDWSRASQEMKWGTIFTVGASLALVRGLREQGVLEALSNLLLALLGDVNPGVVAVAVLLFAAVLRLVITALVLQLAIALPIAVEVAGKVGLDPLWLGMLVVIGGNMILLYPMQSPQSMLTYETGAYRIGDMARLGVPAAVWIAAVVLLTAYVYWPLLGYAP